MTRKPRNKSTTEKPNRKPRVTKATQLEVPGTERKRITAIESVATHLRELRTERMEIQKQEAEAQDKLVAVMREHDVKLYKFDGGEDELVVEIKDKTKASVRSAKTARSEDE